MPVAPARAEGPAAQLLADAKRKLREEDFAGAVRLLEQAVSADPADATANVLYQDTARPILGLADLLTRYRTRAAENPEDPLAQYLATRLEEPKTALAAFEKQALKFKNSPWPLLGQARALEGLGRQSDALSKMDDAVALTGGDRQVRAVQAYALERIGKWGAAADAWRQVIAADATDRAAKLGLAESLRGGASYDEALAVLDEMAKADPRDAEISYRKGLVRLSAEKFADAKADFERALEVNKAFVEALCGAAEAGLRATVIAAKEANQPPEEDALMTALGHAARAAAANPESARAHFVQGTVYEVLGELDANHLDSALTEYDAALERLPFPGQPKVRALVARSFVLLRLARWDEAQAAARQALDIDAGNLAALLHGAHALCQTGKYEDAIKDYYKPGLKIAKDDPRFVYGCGMAYWSAKKQSDAKKLLEQSVKLDPENGLYQLSLGELYYELRQYKDAVKALFQATELRPKDPLTWTAYGRACTAGDHWPEAAEAFEKTVELDPDAVDEFLYLAIIYADQLKDREKAKGYAEKFLEKGGSDPNLQSWLDDLLGS